MGENRVGLVQHLAEIIRRDSVIHERVHDVERQLTVRKPAPAPDFFQIKMWQGFRNIEAAICRQTGQQNILKAQCGRFTPRTDVSHVRTCQLKFSARMRTTWPSVSVRASNSSIARLIWRS